MTHTGDTDPKYLSQKMQDKMSPEKPALEHETIEVYTIPKIFMGDIGSIIAPNHYVLLNGDHVMWTAWQTERHWCVVSEELSGEPFRKLMDRWCSNDPYLTVKFITKDY